MKNGDVNALIGAIGALPADDPLEFVFIGDAPYLRGLATNASQAGTRWQGVLRTAIGVP